MTTASDGWLMTRGSVLYSQVTEHGTRLRASYFLNGLSAPVLFIRVTKPRRVRIGRMPRQSIPGRIKAMSEEFTITVVSQGEKRERIPIKGKRAVQVAQNWLARETPESPQRLIDILLAEDEQREKEASAQSREGKSKSARRVAVSERPNLLSGKPKGV